jgi:transposase
MSGVTQPDDQVEVPHIMRALDLEVFDAVWSAVEPLLPERADDHPLGCHRRRISDKICFWAMLIRLVTGCSWVDVERLVEGKVSDTTLRARRDEWIRAEVFDKIAAEALAAYDRVIGLDLTEVSIDGSLHKAPCGGEGTGKSPVDRGKLGWKWSIATEKNGIPIAWVTDGANRNDCVLLPATLKAVQTRGLVDDIETLHLDRGYDNSVVRRAVAEAGIADLVCAKTRPRGKKKLDKKPLPLGLRWPVERTNSWFSNFGQLRRNTDRCLVQRLAQIDWRDRWSF